MRRYCFVILFALVLLAPFVLRRAKLGAGPNAPAARGGAARLVIVTPHTQDIRREFAAAFSKWHEVNFGQRVEIDYRTPGGTNDIVRLLATTYNALRDKNSGELPPERDVQVDIDVVWGGGDVTFDRDLKSQGILSPLALGADALREIFPEATLAGVKLYDQTPGPGARSMLPPRWVGVCLSSFGIVYSPDLFATLGLPEPRSWDDLTNPRLAGMIALADPVHSGSAAVTYMVVIQRSMADAEADVLDKVPELSALSPRDRSADPRYKAALAEGWQRGMGKLLLMAANTRYFTDSASQVPSDVSNGEAAAGVAIDFYGRVYEEQVGSHRIRFLLPSAAAAVTPDPVAILYGVKGGRRVLADHFVAFLLSQQGQRLWVLKAGTPGGPAERSLRRTPIRRDIYADRTNWSDDVDPFAETNGFNLRAEWMGLFSDTRPLWAAAWIDSRESLRSAYASVISMKNDQRRTALLKELATLPVTMADVEKLRDERKKLEATRPGDADAWRARQRIAWAQKFRDHYRRIADEAR